MIGPSAKSNGSNSNDGSCWACCLASPGFPPPCPSLPRVLITIVCQKNAYLIACRQMLLLGILSKQCRRMLPTLVMAAAASEVCCKLLPCVSPPIGLPGGLDG